MLLSKRIVLWSNMDMDFLEEMIDAAAKGDSVQEEYERIAIRLALDAASKVAIDSWRLCT
jgi:hypothetical protein